MKNLVVFNPICLLSPSALVWRVSSCRRHHLYTVPFPLTDFYRFDYAKQYPEARAELAQWLTDGSLKRKFDIVEGLENAPSALPMLFSGGNTGKLCVFLLL